MNSNEQSQADACSITAIQRIDEPSRQRRDRMEVVIMSTHTTQACLSQGLASTESGIGNGYTPAVDGCL